MILTIVLCMLSIMNDVKSDKCFCYHDTDDDYFITSTCCFKIGDLDQQGKMCEVPESQEDEKKFKNCCIDHGQKGQCCSYVM